MKNFKKHILCVFGIVLLATLPSLAQDVKNPSAQSTTKSIEVSKFEIKEGVKFPEIDRDTMMTEIVDELTKLKKFSEVKAPATAAATTETIAQTATSWILLTGTVTKYQPGSRTKRYLVGFGAGKTKVVASIKLVDKDTGKVLLEKDVDGKVIIGLFGGNSNGATRGLAIEVAKVTKKAVFK